MFEKTVIEKTHTVWICCNKARAVRTRASNCGRDL